MHLNKIVILSSSVFISHTFQTIHVYIVYTYRNIINQKGEKKVILPIVIPVNYKKKINKSNYWNHEKILLSSYISKKKVYFTFWYLTVSSDVLFVGIKARNPYKSRFALFPMISTPTHCERARHCKPQCIIGSVEFFLQITL